MLETGMRPDEVCRIRRENVHLDQGYLFNPFGKQKRPYLGLVLRLADILDLNTVVSIVRLLRPIDRGSLGRKPQTAKDPHKSPHSEILVEVVECL